MPSLKVLVSGASIAGPCAAYWLARAGATVTVIERFPAIRSGGQNVDIRSVGLAVMRKMPGMEEAVRQNLYEIKGFGIVDASGRPIATFSASGNAEAQGMLSEYEIFRADLAHILHDLSEQVGVQYIFGDSISAIQTSGNDQPVRVEFNSGRPSEEYDLVVAADGATSRTRAIGLGCGVRDHIHSMNMYAAWWTVKKDLLEGGEIGYAWSQPPGRSYGIAPMKDGKNKAVLFRVFPRRDTDAIKPFLDANEKAKTDDQALKAHVMKDFTGTGFKAQELLAEAADSDDFYASEMVQVKVPQLYKGRFALVGDAGHAAGPTGVGTSLAMASGYVLAGELLRANGDIMAGLQAFNERMQPIIKDLQTIPPGIPGLMAPQSFWSLWLRNTMLSIFSMLSPLAGYFSWLGGLWSASFGSTERNPLPDYAWVK